MTLRYLSNKPCLSLATLAIVSIFSIGFWACGSGRELNPANNPKIITYSPNVLLPFIDKNWVVKSRNGTGYSFVQKGDQEFGLTFSAPLAYLSHQPLEKLFLQTKVFVKQKSEEAFWVVEINNGKKKLFYEALNFLDSVKTLNYWTPISRTIQLKTPLLSNPQNELKIYFWNKSQIEWEYSDISLQYQ